jgi:hypothetical protein
MLSIPHYHVIMIDLTILFFSPENLTHVGGKGNILYKESLHRAYDMLQRSQMSRVWNFSVTTPQFVSILLGIFLKRINDKRI